MEYKKVENFTKYFVCDDGFVYKACGGTRGLKKLKGMPNSGGYRSIVMVENGYKERWLVHRLVATYFVPNPDNLPYVDHIDGNKLNGFASNLRWVSAKENANNPNTKDIGPKTFRKNHEIPLIFKKEGIEIKCDSQYIASQYFDCDRKTLLDAARNGETIWGFSVSQVEEYNKKHVSDF